VQPLPAELRDLLDRFQANPRGDVVGELARCLRGLPIEIHLHLEQIRVRRTWPELTAWDSQEPKHVPRLGQMAHGWAALGIASLHWNGFVREAAVRALGWCEDGDELPFLLVRLNDWVAPVRAAALSAARARLTPARAADWVRALPIVEKLAGRQRANHRGLIDAVAALLRTPEARPALLAGLASGPPKARLACFRMALETDAGALLEPALAGGDLVVRWEAARRLHLIGDGERRRALIARVVGDRASAVRSLALPLLVGEPEDWRRGQLERLGCDLSPSLRVAARKLLPLDWAARYRILLGDPAGRRAALSGLGETGNEDDVWLVEPYLTDAATKVRAVALVATAALDVDSVELFVAALADPSRRVSRSAARVLRRRARAGLPELLRQAAERTDVPAHTRAHALDVMDAQRFWPRLSWMLTAAASPCHELAELAAARLKVVTSQQPTPSELADVDRALAESPLPPARVAAIRHELDFWRAPTLTTTAK
jgi:hypothetical protein